MATSSLLRLFDLRHDQDTPESIDREVRNAVRVSGTNLWVLIFAILIASVGLNVNSTAVIIGAMLISPLMGPIIGVGYGAGINDSELIRMAARNLGIFAGISLLTSTLYFLLSPLSAAQSELLARTSPTLWDVLVAFFGGCAGMVALTRRDVSNVVPGVAIATALMPPLCTAGYGLATGNLRYAGGAAFLFIINGVFIALATLMFVKLLRLPHHAFASERTRLRTRLVIGIAVAATVLPSAYLAWRLVQDQFFETTASRVVRNMDRDERTILLDHEISVADRRVALTVGGVSPSADYARQVQAQLESAGLHGTRVSVRYAGNTPIDAGQIKRELQQDVYRSTLDELQRQAQRIRELETENQAIRTKQQANQAVAREILAQIPEATAVVVARGDSQDSQRGTDLPATVVLIRRSQPLASEEVVRLQSWLQVRLGDANVHVLDDPAGLPAPIQQRVSATATHRR